MGRNNGGNVLAIFAMIIAIGSLALSGYVLTLNQTPSESEPQTITQIWFDSKESSYTLLTSFYDIPDLELTITVNTGENVYILFNGQFTVSSGTTSGEIRLRIDDTTIDDRSFYSDASGLYHWDSLTLQHVAVGLSAGIHTISMQAAGSSGTIHSMSLVAYTFP